MSLLMKALEKAAQDRDKTPAASKPSTATLSDRELTLEPVTQASHGPVPAQRNATTDARSNAQARAAAVLNAQLPQRTGTMAWLQARPLIAIGGLAGLFMLFYAGYVYVQVAHPGLLIKTPAHVAANAATAPAPRNAPVENTRPANPGTAPQTADAANASLLPKASAFDAGGQPQSTPTDSVPPFPPPAPPERARVIPPQSAPSASLPARSSEAAPAALVAPPSRIAVSHGDNAPPRVNPIVSEAYAALDAGRFDTAQRLYSQVLRSDATNVDALLGLAAIAQHEGRTEDAQRHFLAILNVEPRHALAQSGLIALMGRADPQAAETRLKQLLAREPSAPLHFNLGNLYAEQGQWPQAQQAYFQAHNLEPRNPDYAYNLAVGLEHLGQQKLALGFYRKALQLASAKGSAHFETERIQARISQLAAQFE
jgi:tetratricopeptide (TPR) repeat protein